VQFQHSRRIGTPKLLGPFGGEDDGYVGGDWPRLACRVRLPGWCPGKSDKEVQRAGVLQIGSVS